jgi:DNA modification methylase
MPANSVHCCVTSPPYWGLRDYGTPPQVWGGDPDCRHRWGAEGKSAQRLRNGVGSDTAKQAVPITLHPRTGAFCARCGAWRGSLGLEPTYQLYVDHLVEVLREVRRVLRPDGTLWLVIGDCYATGGGKAKKPGGRGQGERWENYGPPGTQPNRMPQPGLKPKDLVGIPWRVAFALQDEGWWLRRDQVWHKPNPMPESIKDRCTSGHEYLFHLSKSARYYFDHEAIKEPAVNGELFHGDYAPPGGVRERNGRQPRPSVVKGGFAGKTAGTDKPAFHAVTATRHKRSVWTVATSPFPEAHFATYPPALVEPCILAGTSERGVCSDCGAPWRRLVRKQLINTAGRAKATKDPHRAVSGSQAKIRNGQGRAGDPVTETIGWRPTCSCAAGDPVPAIVLDPFLGAGTTAMVADRLGRDCIGVELSLKYAGMARRRIAAAPGSLAAAA